MKQNKKENLISYLIGEKKKRKKFKKKKDFFKIICLSENLGERN